MFEVPTSGISSGINPKTVSRRPAVASGKKLIGSRCNRSKTEDGVLVAFTGRGPTSPVG
ncbi:hypothetical protein AVEN_152652-1, partial [Araneus ventricosus]